MISDKVKLFFLDVDHVLMAFFILFFAGEAGMLYALPYTDWWIPIVSIMSRVGITWSVPEIGDHRFFYFMYMIFVSYIGYGILLFMAPEMLWFVAVATVSILAILVLQFTGAVPDAEDRVRQRMTDKQTLWFVCQDVESEKKDD